MPKTPIPYVVGMTYISGRRYSLPFVPFRDGLGARLDDAKHGHDEVIVMRRETPMAALVSTEVLDLIDELERGQHEHRGYSNTETDPGSKTFITRDELSLDLAKLGEQLGGGGVYLTAGEATQIAGLLANQAARYPAERFGTVNGHWAARLRRRITGEL